MKSRVKFFLKQLIDLKKERIEEIEKDKIHVWSADLIESLEKDIYELESMIEDKND